jgi:hypothetical protein
MNNVIWYILNQNKQLIRECKFQKYYLLNINTILFL